MSREVPLAAGRGVAIVDDADYAWAMQYSWYLVSGYAVRVLITEGGQRAWVLMHRELMNTPAGLDTDHMNNNRLDNRRSNLRLATRSQNMANTPPHKDSRSKYKGIFFHPQTKKWRARLCCRGRIFELGLHQTPEDAARAYNNKARELFGEFAYVNIIEEAA